MPSQSYTRSRGGRSRGGRSRGGRSRGRARGRRGGRDTAAELGLAGSLVGVSALTQGTELQNGSYQEQNDLLMGGGNGQRKAGCANDIAGPILCFVELLNTIKIFHWSTRTYSIHKATDELHEKLSKLVDSFIEIYIGHCSRKGGSGVPVFQFKNGERASIEFCECKSLAAFCKVLDDNIIHLEGLTKSLDGYTDLVNIRDEMVGALAHALYLCSLTS